MTVPVPYAPKTTIEWTVLVQGAFNVDHSHPGVCAKCMAVIEHAIQIALLGLTGSRAHAIEAIEAQELDYAQ